MVFALFTICLFGQKKVKEKDIIKSQDIEVIEIFLKQSHPEDPRNPILKKRLIRLKNEAWVKGRETAKPMAPRDLVLFENLTKKDSIILDEDYRTLLEESKTHHKEKTTNILNTLFDYEKTSSEVALLIRNQTKCNIVVRMKGMKQYSVAIPQKSESTLVVEKDKYQINSKVCNTPYTSEKEIKKSIAITLNDIEHKNQ